MVPAKLDLTRLLMGKSDTSHDRSPIVLRLFCDRTRKRADSKWTKLSVGQTAEFDPRNRMLLKSFYELRTFR